MRRNNTKYFQTEFDRLTPAQKNRRRYFVWYRRWSGMATMLKHLTTPKNAEIILIKMWNLIEETHGHHKNFIAYSSYVSLLLVVEDCINISCDECKHRYRCFTE